MCLGFFFFNRALSFLSFHWCQQRCSTHAAKKPSALAAKSILLFLLPFLWVINYRMWALFRHYDQQVIKSAEVAQHLRSDVNFLAGEGREMDGILLTDAKIDFKFFTWLRTSKTAAPSACIEHREIRIQKWICIFSARIDTHTRLIYFVQKQK